MNIFMVDMHSRIPVSFAQAFKSFGAKLYLAGNSFRDIIVYGRKWTQEEINSQIKIDNVFSIEYDEFMADPPDVYMIMCYEQERDQIALWEKFKNNKTKIVYYSGNDNMFYNPDYCNNLIAADISTYSRFTVLNKHTIYYFPWIDYDSFSYEGPCHLKMFRIFANSFQSLFPASYELARQAMTLIPDVSWQLIDGVSPDSIPQLMKGCMATINTKHIEGYGYSIIESLAVGRPVIIYRPWSVNRSYTKWCIDGETSLYFNNADEFIAKTRKLIDDEQYRITIQETASRRVREIINNDEQNRNLKKFFEELV